MFVETTDPQDELFDVLDSNGKPTGAVKPRGAVHRDGDWHRGLHVWVYSIESNGRAYILFQRRSMGKDTWPGALDVAVGGHFSTGETLEDTLRETEEEIGLRATINELTPLGRRFIDYNGPGVIDRELNEVYALRCDQPLAAYRQHPDEVDGIVAIELSSVTALFHGECENVSAYEVARDGTEAHLTVRMSDIAGERNEYCRAVAAGIHTLVNGRQPQPFLIRERPSTG